MSGHEVGRLGHIKSINKSQSEGNVKLLDSNTKLSSSFSMIPLVSFPMSFWGLCWFRTEQLALSTDWTVYEL